MPKNKNLNNAFDSMLSIPDFEETTETTETTQEEKRPAKMGRPRKKDLVRDNSVQAGLTDDYTRATFILKVETLNELKNYAYTERLAIKDAIENIISDFMTRYKKNNELLERKEK